MLWLFEAPLLRSASGRQSNGFVSKGRKGDFSFAADDFIYIDIIKSRKTPIPDAVDT